jgi:hypothetical protein
MIGVYDIEERIYGYFDTIFGSEKSWFRFNTASSACFLVDRETDAPRPAASTLLFYRVDSVSPMGNTISIDDVVVDRATKEESVSTWRKIHVIVNILSKYKGDAKDALNFILAANQTTRGYNASYITTGATGFEMPLYYIDPNFRDLTGLENTAWTERVEADFYFNYKDSITFGEQGLITAPSSVYLTKDKVDFDIELK